VPGGIGTLLEMSVAWQLLQVRQLHNVPLILVGRMWPELIAWARKFMLREEFGLASPQDFEIPQCTSDVDETVALIRARREAWLAAQGGSRHAAAPKAPSCDRLRRVEPERTRVQRPTDRTSRMISLVAALLLAATPAAGAAAEAAATGAESIELIRLSVRAGHESEMERFLARLAEAARRTGEPVRWRVHRRVGGERPLYVFVLRGRAEQLDAWSGLTASATLERAYGAEEAARILALRESALEGLERERFVAEPELGFDD
jgi:hypothetical protein